MFNSYRFLLLGFGAALTLHNGAEAFAQGLDIQPITLDIITDVEQQDELVLASVSVASDSAPLIEGLVQSPSNATQAAVRATDGFPVPSVILGFIAPGQEALFGLARLLPATVAEIAFALDDLAAREALRSGDPEMFKRLVEEGHIDPDPSELNRVLQVELKRMNCYRSGIDGSWGPGSRRSVGNYFEQLSNVVWPDQAPTAELFRAVIINGDVDCPTPVAAQPVARTQSTTTRRTTTTTTQRAAPKPKAAAPAAKPKKPSISAGGIGVFR